MTEAQELIRLTRVLEQRGAVIEPVLRAVQAAGTQNMILCASSLTNRLELCVNLVRDAVALVAPGGQPGTLPSRGMLRLVVDGAGVTGAITSIGPMSAREATGARDAWLAVVEPLLAIPGSYVMNRTRCLGEAREMIGIAYPSRDADLERRFVAMIEAHATRIGLSSTQLAIWRKTHEIANTREPLSVNTEHTSAGPIARLAVLHGRSDWDHAIEVVKTIAPDRATEAAAVLGLLAATFEIDAPRGLEVILGAGVEVDLVVWAMRG